MTNLAQHRCWSSRIRLRAANGALLLVVALGQVVVATPSAEAQADATGGRKVTVYANTDCRGC